MSLINNRDKTLQQALKNALGSVDQVDIQAGFFFLSGFSSLAEELKDKKIRILVGLRPLRLLFCGHCCKGSRFMQKPVRNCS
jgi:hypothetical protein